MPFLKFHYKPKNELEAGGRTAALLQEDASEPEKTCPNCHKAIPLSRLWSNYNTCPCGYHFRMGGRQRLRMLVDKGTFRELLPGWRGMTPWDFPATGRSWSRSRPPATRQRVCSAARPASGASPAVCLSWSRIL